MARLPHLVILRDIHPGQAGRRPILSLDMDRYARVSTERQADNDLSVPDQIARADA